MYGIADLFEWGLVENTSSWRLHSFRVAMLSTIARRIAPLSVAERRIPSVLTVSRSVLRRSPLIAVRSLSSTSHNSRFKEFLTRFLYNRSVRAFTTGTAITCGGLLGAGFFGYVNDSGNGRQNARLKSRIENVRKNYPNIRNFPVRAFIILDA